MVTDFGNMSLVGRVFSKKRCNAKFISTGFCRIWKTKKKWNVKILKRETVNSYVGCTFESDEDLQKVNYKMPWNFRGRLMIIEEWLVSGQWVDAKLGTIPIWIKMAGFPLKAFNVSNIEKLGNMVSNVMEEVKGSNNHKMLLTYSVCVKIVFPTGCRIMVRKHMIIEGRQQWIYFKFEKFPRLCFTCGKWGHDKRECNEEKVMEKSITGEMEKAISNKKDDAQSQATTTSNQSSGIRNVGDSKHEGICSGALNTEKGIGGHNTPKMAMAAQERKNYSQKDANGILEKVDKKEDVKVANGIDDDFQDIWVKNNGFVMFYK
ncbi:uncharacterized protein LOC133824383 [Humulus lupulus]|uniref:uncharacterized protein LOC133824383 n=1 Tax=Humulus lupulus TaxID=3486 RepID=UPI002B40DFD4|nr:uncharacterized protein LOC133824383 [Humulus lupulus]